MFGDRSGVASNVRLWVNSGRRLGGRLSVGFVVFHIQFQIVYTSDDSLSGCDIVMKSMDVENEFSRKQFLKELKIISSLNHQNIVTMYAYSVKPMEVCMYQEYMAFEWSGEQHESNDLSHFVQTLVRANKVEEFNKMSPWVRYIATDIAKGLDHLHIHGIAHRDLKLQNVLVTNHPSSTQGLLLCKLCDFGEARAYSVQTNTMARTATIHTERGTVCYQAPEIILKTCQKATFIDLMHMDIWAFGVCLHIILNPNLQDPYGQNRKKMEDVHYTDYRAVMSDVMGKKETPICSDEYSFLREQYATVERIRVSSLNYVPSKRPTTNEIVQM